MKLIVSFSINAYATVMYGEDTSQRTASESTVIILFHVGADQINVNRFEKSFFYLLHTTRQINLTMEKTVKLLDNLQFNSILNL